MFNLIWPCFFFYVWLGVIECCWVFCGILPGFFFFYRVSGLGWPPAGGHSTQPAPREIDATRVAVGFYWFLLGFYRVFIGPNGVRYSSHPPRGWKKGDRGRGSLATRSIYWVLLGFNCWIGLVGAPFRSSRMNESTNEWNAGALMRCFDGRWLNFIHSNAASEFFWGGGRNEFLWISCVLLSWMI